MIIAYKCPGSFGSGTPVIKIKKCPQCGSEAELFSIDMKVDCPFCGQPVLNNINTCAEYCLYAEQCLGMDIYGKFKK
jgi:hypothetical protein